MCVSVLVKLIWFITGNTQIFKHRHLFSYNSEKTLINYASENQGWNNANCIISNFTESKICNNYSWSKVDICVSNVSADSFRQGLHLHISHTLCSQIPKRKSKHISKHVLLDCFAIRRNFNSSGMHVQV